MKTLSVFLVFVLAVSVSAQKNKFNSGIFLHHSTGWHIWGPNDTTVSVPQEIDAYNKAHGLKDSSAFSLDERHWPVAPDNEWVRWRRIFDNKDTTADIRPILRDNPIVIIKSCFPSCQMTGSGSPADTLKPDEKTIYNYKWHLRSIVRTMKQHPDNFFVIWTNAPLVPKVTNAMQAALSDSFCTWMKDTLARGLDAEFGAFPANVFVFDFFHKTADKNGMLLMKYAVDSLDSHPNKAATMEITPQFVKEVLDAILDSYQAPVVSTSSASLDFGEKPAGSKTTLTVSIKNSSRGQFLIDSVRTRTRWFTAAFRKANITNGDSSVISVSFAPDTARSAYNDTLYIYNNTPQRLVALPLSGVSPAPALTSSLAAMTFADAAKGDTVQMTLTVYNRTINPLVIRTMKLSGPSVFSWSVPLPAAVTPRDSLLIPIRFTPNTPGKFSDTLAIGWDTGVMFVMLNGTSPAPRIAASLAALDFGIVMKTRTVQREIALTNSAIATLYIDSITTRTPVFGHAVMTAGGSVRATDAGSLPVTSKDTLTLRVTFTPDSLMKFSDTLTIYSNGQPAMLKIPLAGVGEKLTAVEAQSGSLPREFALSQNYPNPFNPSTTIRFALPERSRVSLIVYDAVGRQALVLADGDLGPGAYAVSFDASRLSSGMYFYRMQAAHGGSVYTETRRFILMK